MIENKFQIEGTIIRVFDVETKTPIADYKNCRVAEDCLGVRRNSINRRCGNKARFEAPKLNNLMVTCRIVKKELAKAA